MEVIAWHTLTVFYVFYCSGFVRAFFSTLPPRTNHGPVPLDNGQLETRSVPEANRPTPSEYLQRSDSVTDRLTRNAADDGIAALVSSDLPKKRQTSVPLIDDNTDVELVTGYRMSDIPERSFGSIWNTIVAGSGDTATAIGGNTANTVTVSNGSRGDFTTTRDEFTVPEGSGGWTAVGTTQETTVAEDRVTLPPFCFEKQCNSTELHVPGNAKFPEGSDVVVVCERDEHERRSSLFWYFVNGSNLILKNSSEDQKVNLSVASADVLDSGVYRCVKLDVDSCCHTELHITVYGIPAYENHILIVGIVAVSFLVVCLALVVWRNHRNEKNIKKLRNFNSTKHQLLQT